MNKIPDENRSGVVTESAADQTLRRFLQENRPDIPAMPAALEEQILDATVRTARHQKGSASKGRWFFASFVLLPVLSALLIFLRPAGTKTFEIASTTPTVVLVEENGLSDEAAWEFMEESWSGVQNENSIVQVADALETL